MKPGPVAHKWTATTWKQRIAGKEVHDGEDWKNEHPRILSIDLGRRYAMRAAAFRTSSSPD